MALFVLELANEEDVAREAQERDSLRNLRVAEAEEAKNEGMNVSRSNKNRSVAFWGIFLLNTSA